MTTTMNQHPYNEDEDLEGARTLWNVLEHYIHVAALVAFVLCLILMGILYHQRDKTDEAKEDIRSEQTDETIAHGGAGSITP